MMTAPLATRSTAGPGRARRYQVQCPSYKHAVAQTLHAVVQTLHKMVLLKQEEIKLVPELQFYCASKQPKRQVRNMEHGGTATPRARTISCMANGGKYRNPPFCGRVGPMLFSWHGRCHRFLGTYSPPLCIVDIVVIVIDAQENRSWRAWF